ncbi:MAG: helical backbone metal receptor [Chloroflexota bacterium]
MPATGAAQTASPGQAGSEARSVTDDTGVVVTIAGTPARIASLSPAITEIVFALGAGDRLVGGTDFDDYPADILALPDIATYQGVLVERLAALEPDLVLASGMGLTPDADIARLRELGYPVVTTY